MIAKTLFMNGRSDFHQNGSRIETKTSKKTLEKKNISQLGDYYSELLNMRKNIVGGT